MEEDISIKKKIPVLVTFLEEGRSESLSAIERMLKRKPVKISPDKVVDLIAEGRRCPLRRLVIDSSASLKWWLDDEEYVAEARGILKQIHTGIIIPVVPDIWHYEIANGIRTAVNPLSPLFTESRMETVND